MLRQPVFNWSVGIGRLWGVALEIHLTLLLGFALVLAFTAEQMPAVGLVAILVWLVSVALHELGHAIAAVRLGGRVEALVLGPAGGLQSPEVPDEPEPQVFVAFAGPIVHLGLVVASTGFLVFLGANDLLVLLTTLLPFDLFTDSAVTIILIAKLTLWVNWVLFLLNWLPVYPFDAAPALRALLWPVVGRRSSHVMTSRLGLGVSAALFLAGVYVYATVGVESYFWAVLLFLSLFSAVSALRDLDLFDDYETDAAVDDFWNLEQDESTDDDLYRYDSGHMVLVEQHYAQLRERYDRQRKAREDYEDARVDDILARMHNDGFDHLPPEDQAFLHRASQRYRDRRSREA